MVWQAKVIQTISAVGMQRVFYSIRVFIHVCCSSVSAFSLEDDVKLAKGSEVVVSTLAAGMKNVNHSIAVCRQVADSAV